MIKGLLHSAISVKNMEESLRFYCGILEVRQLFSLDDPDGEPQIICLQMVDGSCLELFYPRAEYPVEEKIGRNHFCLIVDDIFALEKTLDAADVAILSRPQIVRDGNWQLWCLDPSGYRVEFMQMMPDCLEYNSRLYQTSNAGATNTIDRDAGEGAGP